MGDFLNKFCGNRKNIKYASLTYGAWTPLEEFVLGRLEQCCLYESDSLSLNRMQIY